MNPQRFQLIRYVFGIWPALPLNSSQGKQSTSPPTREPSSSPHSPTSLFSGSDRSSPETAKSKALPTLARQASPSPPKEINHVPAKTLSTSSTQGRQNIARGVKFLEMPIHKVVGGSSLSTKQRIASVMIEPKSTKPKPPIPPPRSNSFSSLSFKKTASKPSEEKLTIQTQPMSPVASSATHSSSYPGTYLENVIDSPVGLESLQDAIPHHEPFDPDISQPDRSLVLGSFTRLRRLTLSTKVCRCQNHLQLRWTTFPCTK
jgi:hypothetical protein